MRNDIPSSAFLFFIFIFIFISTYPVSTAHAQSEIYECRDSEGRKIFANVCPAGSKKIKEITILASPSPGTSNNSNQSTQKPGGKSLAELDQEFKKRQAQKEEAEALERDRLRAEEAKCEDEKKKLAELQDGIALKTGKDANGNPSFMEDKKREELIKLSTEKIKKCR